MAVLSRDFLFNLESNMRVIQEAEYRRLTSNLWWNKVARVMPTSAGKEIVNWILNTAVLELAGANSDGADPLPKYRDMAIQQTTFTPKYIAAALKLQRAQFEDLDGNGVSIATEWVTQMGAQQAYYPQKNVASVISNGETGLAYDGLAYFSNAHLVNPKDSSKGTFANLFTGASASTPATDANDVAYPGALNVATSTIEGIFTGLQNIYGYIGALKMANGLDPRMIRPAGILCPTRIYPKMLSVLNSQFIAATAAGSANTAGGSQDIRGQLAALGYGEVVHCPEFDSDPTSFYIVAEQLASSQLGAIVYLDREQPGIRYYTGQDGANVDLGRTDELEWIARGRADAGYGHPYLLYKVKAS